MNLPTPLFSTSFIRANSLAPLFSGLEKSYLLSPDDLGIPCDLFSEPMTLLPYVDVNQWFEEIEKRTQNEGYMLAIKDELMFNKIADIGNWFFSCPILSLTFRRINYSMSSLQSGATFYGEQSGKILKWCYNNYLATGRGRLHDSLRIAIMFTNALRKSLGQANCLLTVEISGPPCAKEDTEAFFGCKVKWNAPITKVWVAIDMIEKMNAVQDEDPTLALSLSGFELDDYLNMPHTHDPAKILYELINYSRFYQFPKLDFVAKRLDLSSQQLQRRLQHFGWNFTNLTNYTLVNIAIRYMLDGLSPQEIAPKLGYNNVMSFNKAFQRNKGYTPLQYIESFKR